ncbi:hypothetical protein TWF192_000720 [Orbilia oligospora]|uniref:DNA endonuclease activator Ctp1 C-terminal domain-containing protein n=2 Tax=Orbilia oligospora TaxID=2813651 RepID=A0A6G1LVL5_ORBOL|nr:hypothetical protein TWF191_005291 [Orbilia oligospora]KAF3198764.1 hypothetical protein TWF679_001777 [Orbilia oligospora]KAF3235473.1 hypothetical protein TWF192_000720 [Orbilia oligospora]
MTTSINRDLIFGPILEKSETFQQQLAAAILAAASLSKDLELQHQSKVATLEAEIERLRGPKPPPDSYPPYSPNAFHTIDGVEYVTKDEYSKVLKSLQLLSKKNCLVQQNPDRSIVDGSELREETPRAQDDKQRELDMERAKVKEFERKFGTITQLLDLSQTVIQAVIKTSTDAARQYRKYGEEDDQWRAEMLERGIATASDFDRRPARDPWPSIATPLRHLFMTISSHNMMRTRGQSIPPPTGSTPTQLLKPAPPSSSTQDPDVTSDEESVYEEEETESALQKFSPTSKAIMRKPGSETLAVLHPEPLSPIQSHRASVDWEGTEDALVNIKSELMSEHDWYSKYGYSHTVHGEQETFDLDNTTVPRRGYVGIRSFGQAISTPKKDGIRSPFLTQSSWAKSSRDAKGDQSAVSDRERVHNGPIFHDTSEEEPALSRSPSRMPRLKEDPNTATKVTNVEAVPMEPLPVFKEDGTRAPSKQTPSPEPMLQTEAYVVTGLRNPLREIIDPNGLIELDGADTINLQPCGSTKQLDKLAGNEEIHEKENPPVAKNLTNRPSTPTQNSRHPPMFARSTGALKLKSKSICPISAEKQPIKRSSLVFTHEPVTALVESTQTAATTTPGEKRPPGGPQGSFQKKKQRTEKPTAPTAAPAIKNPDNPFSPSKYRINKSKNEGLDFAFSEVVRNRARKDCLPKCIKECCRDLASGRLHEMWKPPAPYESAKFGARDSSPPDKEEIETKDNEQYKEWNAAREKSERNLQFGRHRAQHQKAPEVMGYWESDFPTTQLLEEQRKDSERRHMEKGFDRYEQATKGGIYERRA